MQVTRTTVTRVQITPNGNAGSAPYIVAMVTSGGAHVDLKVGVVKDVSRSARLVVSSATEAMALAELFTTIGATLADEERCAMSRGSQATATAAAIVANSK